MKKKHYWIVIGVREKAEVGVTINIKSVITEIDFRMADGMIGVLPIFDDWEKAEEFACGLDVIMIESDGDLPCQQ